MGDLLYIALTIVFFALMLAYVAVWGPNAVAHTHYLRVYMTQQRHKLERDPTRPRHLQTEPGAGYRLKVE